MYNLKTTLLSKEGFIDNDYLELYCRLIERNIRTIRKPRLTNKHHIIPKAWFKLNYQEIDNSLSNLVNLIYREHVLAHYYLCLCTEGPLKWANELAFICLISRKKLSAPDRQLICNLPAYNNIYEDYLQNKHSNYQLYRKDNAEQ